MKRILYIEANTDGTIGGSYYSLLYLIQGLDKTRYEPHVMFCQDNVLIPEFKAITPYVYVNNFGPSGNGPAKTFKQFIKWPYLFVVDIILKQPMLRKIIKEIKPELVSINNGHAALHEWMLASYLNKVKVVAHDRGTGYPCSLRTRMFVRLLDAIICVSDHYKDNVTRQNLKVRLVRRVYNGLDTEMISGRISPVDIDRLRKEFKLKKDEPVIGITGNIDRWKGQAVVLRALKKVRAVYPGIKCLIIGQVAKGAKKYKTELDEYIAENGLRDNVIFTGFRKDIPNLLSLLDIMLHASITPEPFGRVILEGMAAGKPIIATNSGGTVEQIVNNETGILVPMNDPDKMADAIIFFISNPAAASEMGEKGKKRLTDLFSIKRMVSETAQVYEEIFNFQA